MGCNPTEDVVGEKVDRIRQRLNTALDNTKALLNRVEDETLNEARAAVKCVSDNPCLSIAIAVAAGAIICGIIAFGCSRKCD